MSSEHLPLILRNREALGIASHAEGRIIAEMVSGALQFCNKLNVRTKFHVGDYELCEPDYRQVLVWAEATAMTPETVMESLFGPRVVEGELPLPWAPYGKEAIQDGRIIRLHWDLELVPWIRFEWVEGLAIQTLSFSGKSDTKSREAGTSGEGAEQPNTTEAPVLRLANKFKAARLSCEWTALEEELGPERTFIAWLRNGQKIPTMERALELLKTSNPPDRNKDNGRVLSIRLPELRNLRCEDLRLDALDLRTPKMNKLCCNGNFLTEIDLSKLPALESFIGYRNMLTELHLSHVPRLDDLWCDDNRLTELDLSHVPRLVELRCRGNQLTALDLSHVPELVYLHCSNNRITELNLWRLEKLENLGCYSNKLTILDLSHVRELVELDCSNNQLTELDIHSLNQLKELSYDNNRTRLIKRPDQNF